MSSAIGLVILEQFGIFTGAEQMLEVVGIVDVNLEHPTGLVGVFIDLLGAFFERFVDFKDLARDWGEQVGDGFYGFDCAKSLPFFKVFTYFGQFDEDDISQLRLGKISDADCCYVAVL